MHYFFSGKASTRYFFLVNIDINSVVGVWDYYGYLGNDFA
jgi:hypothetical protein